jgi:MurNAc alpha-1-phosphate uridylyltransferase
MKAMLLAAGRGSRLRPWTDNTPKPLLPVAGKPLIVHHLEKLASAGFTEIIINVSHLGNQIEQALGNGDQFGVQIYYSKENTALETGGGIYNVLHLLGPDPFLVINADIYTDFPFTHTPLLSNDLGHIVLVNNPAHNLKGDYHLTQDCKIALQNLPKFTFSGIGIYTPELFHDCMPGVFRLPSVFESAISTQQLTGEIYSGLWCDVGTIDRWQILEKSLTI